MESVKHRIKSTAFKFFELGVWVSFQWLDIRVFNKEPGTQRDREINSWEQSVAQDRTRSEHQPSYEETNSIFLVESKVNTDRQLFEILNLDIKSS